MNTAAYEEFWSPEGRRKAGRRLDRAVRRTSLLSAGGIGEYVFSRLFHGLVYAQIWEDPEVDMEALRIAPGHRIVAIASGGCNALSYLVADPARIETVDLNPAHVAFNRLKLAALAGLPDHAAFFRFYGHGADPANLDAYARHVRPLLDPQSRAYWEGRGPTGRRRIAAFSRGLYRQGLLGAFIGAGHAVARLHGVDPQRLLSATTPAEQRRIFDAEIAPLFERPLLRWIVARKASLFGLGIPPQQYEALAGGGAMTQVLRNRLERLACGFPLADNYFAWQAFGRGYGTAADAPLPPYLRQANYDVVKARADRVSIANASVTELLAARPDASIDRFALLDAQDWMSQAQLQALWREITRVAAPGARVIFRTAAAESPLPGRVAPALLARWEERAAESRALHARDRSSIYGGFHLLVLKG